jgi:hypothetical protein
LGNERALSAAGGRHCFCASVSGMSSVPDA